MKSQKKTHKIALYIRVSTEEQATNPEGSIKSQEQRLRSHVEHRNQDGFLEEVTAVYIDRAKSGKDTNRPELQKLLTAIRCGEVSLVLVTELSRLSRSIKDFCDIWELMRAHGCEFQSLREQFDTTTAAGEMVLYTIANIAQFERKQCSERISANLQARAQRGLFNGGSIPFGYESDPDRRGFLKIKEDEASIVREAFQTFFEEGSLAKAGKALNERGLRLAKRRCRGGKSRLGYFTVGNLYDMLTNKAYAGIRRYKIAGEAQESKACWDPIIPLQKFERAQATLKSNYRRLKTHSNKRYPFMLSGLARCGSCGDRLPGKSAHGNGGKIPYYEHGWATKRQAYLNKKVFHCDPHRVLAKKLEPAVWDELIKHLSRPELAKSIIADATRIHESQGNSKELDRVRRKSQGITEQIDALAEHLSKIPKGISPTPIFTQMEKLETLKKEATKEMERLQISEGAQEMPVELRDYEKYLELVRSVLPQAETLPELKQRIVEALIHKVEVLPEGFRVHFYVGRDRFIQNEERGLGFNPGPRPFSNFNGSKSLTNGRDDWISFEPSWPSPSLRSGLRFASVQNYLPGTFVNQRPAHQLRQGVAARLKECRPF